jgi:molecular chaperone DnaK
MREEDSPMSAPPVSIAPRPPGQLVGIDLGTTYSAIATLDERGQAVTVPNRDGDLLTPSAVLLLDDGSAVVGQAALDVALDQPARVATLIKRRMGFPGYGRSVAGRDFRPETLAALILRKLIQDAEPRIGKIGRAVITVPAYFDETRRKATHDAGRMAGIDVLDVLDEPTAAALAYAHTPTHGSDDLRPDQLQPGESRTVLVYDLGGGTFDVTLVRLGRKRFQTLAIEGDVRLGGKDWDDRIVDHVAEQFIAKFGTDPRQDPVSLANLQSIAERVKRTLSKLPQTGLTCTHGGQVLTMTLTRAEFETLTRDLLLRTRLTTQKVLGNAGLTWQQVDRILMVGGSSHMPMTWQMLHDLSGAQPDRSLAVSEVVARGAAIHAGIVAAAELQAAARDLLGDVVEVHVNAHSLGIEIKTKTGDRVNSVLIPKNTQLPTEASRTFHTIAENQSTVRVKVLQGEAPQADACISIGECWIEGLPPKLPARSPILVRCAVGSNGLVDVEAKDEASGKMARTTIRRTSGLSDHDIEREAEFVRSLMIL